MKKFFFSLKTLKSHRSIKHQDAKLIKFELVASGLVVVIVLPLLLRFDARVRDQLVLQPAEDVGGCLRCQHNRSHQGRRNLPHHSAHRARVAFLVVFQRCHLDDGLCSVADAVLHDVVSVRHSLADVLK